MMNRRGFLTSAGAAGVAVAGGGALTGCTRPERGENEILVWGVGGSTRQYETEVVEAFRKENPDVKITVNNVPSSGTGDATQVITAVRAGTAPDLWWMDRFSGAQYAALGLLEPIDDLIEKYEDDDLREQYLPFAMNELKLNGKTYGLPTSTDTRVLYYNKKVLRESGIDLDELDPANGAPTVARLDELSDQLIKTDSRGNYAQLGLIPWSDQGSGYLYSLGNGASFFDDETCGVDLTAQPILDAYVYLDQWTREKDYNRVDAFKATYEPPNHPPAQTSFLGQQQGFVIQTNNYRTSVKKYAPDLELGYTHLPVFDPNDPIYTWSGGFSLVMPKGSSKSKAAWDFMKFYAGRAGQSIMIPQTGELPTYRDLLGDPAFGDAKFFIDQLAYSTSRPPFPVSQVWWEAMFAAQESIKLGSASPIEALRVAQARVSPQMDLYCPFRMPEGYGKTGI
ncbi:ABC transporter substrate-binding protein [Microlunatus sp. GCM10028923]|uniref:ABC transporter substrate-binding protein n=1 Tax=Microlunatus sp. GCM10028923 TaxID=3273400 RepID=UPI003620F4B4